MIKKWEKKNEYIEFCCFTRWKILEEQHVSDLSVLDGACQLILIEILKIWVPAPRESKNLLILRKVFFQVFNANSFFTQIPLKIDASSLHIKKHFCPNQVHYRFRWPRIFLACFRWDFYCYYSKHKIHIWLLLNAVVARYIVESFFFVEKVIESWKWWCMGL